MGFFNMQSIVLCTFLIGYVSVLALEDCTVAEYDLCANAVVAMAGKDQAELCSGPLDESIKCLESLKDRCTLTEGMEVEDPISKMKESKMACDMTTTAATSVDKENDETTCTLEAVEKCMKLVNNSDAVFCRMVETGIPCVEDTLANCLNVTIKTMLEGKNKELKDQKALEKCCDTAALKLCDFVEITNETASDENCMKLAKGKACVEKELETCSEKLVVDSMMEHKEGADKGLELCKSKGYKIVSDDNDDKDGANGGNTKQAGHLLLAFTAILFGLFGTTFF